MVLLHDETHERTKPDQRGDVVRLHDEAAAARPNTGEHAARRVAGEAVFDIADFRAIASFAGIRQGTGHPRR